MTNYVFTLYITGEERSQVDKLKEILNKDLTGQYKLKVVDISKNPDVAETKKVMATPLLEKELPPPVRRILGDLSDPDKIIIGLDIIEDKKKKVKK
jgi:circadian clock protein KaiB